MIEIFVGKKKILIIYYNVIKICEKNVTKN